MWISYVLPIIGVAACMFGIYREGNKKGYYTGMSDGYLNAIRDLCEGHMSVEGRTLCFDDDTCRFYDTEKGEFVKELDMDELEFRED